MAPITHIVLFQYKPELSAAEVNELNGQMLALKDKCVKPDTGKPYILSTKGGVDNSIEGRQDGISHAFVVEFETVEDRDYYVQKDQAHISFVQGIVSKILKAQVIDFTPGTF